MKKHLITLYLDWVNNWLTLSVMAEHYGIDPIDLDQLIHIGRKLHNESIQEAQKHIEP